MGFFSSIGKVAMAPANILTGGAAGKILGRLGVATGLTAPNFGVAPKSAAQQEAEQMLLKRARGEDVRKGPSVAEMQLQQAQQQAQKKLLGALSAQRSRNIGLARREALRASAEQQTQVGQQAAILRAQEEESRRKEQQQAAAQLLGAGAQEQALKTQTDIAREQAQQAAFGKLLGSGAMLGAAAISDEKAKKNVKSGNKNIEKFLDSLSGMSYNYKEGKGENPKDKNIGVMAQDLEKTPEGKAMVEDVNGTKQVDFGKGFNALLASMVHLNDKMKKMEDKKDIEKIVKAVLKKERKA